MSGMQEFQRRPPKSRNKSSFGFDRRMRYQSEIFGLLRNDSESIGINKLTIELLTFTRISHVCAHLDGLDGTPRRLAMPSFIKRDLRSSR